jgi:branched-chain amino acid transport system permease protein
MDFHYFLQQMVNGLSVGAIYALIAVGYTMVYGILRLINFAHGDVFMIGAMVSLLLAQSLAWTGGFAVLFYLLVAILVCSALGFAIERLAYRPLRNQARLTSLITAIGVSLLLEYGGQLPFIFGPTDKVMPQVWPALSSRISAGGVEISYIDLVVFGLTLLLMLGLTYIVLYTRIGLAIRAVSFNFGTASLMGVNVNRVISYTFILGSALAAAGGLLYAMKYLTINPLTGLVPGLKAFIAAVIGGIGNIPGAVVGGILLGVVEGLVAAYIPQGSQYRDGAAFLILITILLVSPSGLFGKSTVEKV